MKRVLALLGVLLLPGAPLMAQVPAAQNPLKEAMDSMSSVRKRLATAALPGFTGEIVVDEGRGAVTSAYPRPGAEQSGFQRWRWASVTKQVVAVLIMQEVAKGRIALDAPASRYLKGAAVPGGDAVTVRRLLNHTSGLFDPDDGPKNAAGDVIAYLRTGPKPPRGLDRACLQPSGRAVGTFRYNNCDYVLAGAILEQVTGQPFARLVQQRIARPLGLKTLAVTKAGARAVDIGFDAKGSSDAAIDPGRYGSAGNLAGSAEDMAAFGRALVDGRLLPAAARAEMWKGDPALGYAALGQWSFPADLRQCPAPVAIVERRGAIGNVQVRHLIAPERGLVLVMITDSGAFDFGEIWQGQGPSHDVLAALLCPGKAA
jgi:CubicO group peptidase (beta-lactamase class C family)